MTTYPIGYGTQRVSLAELKLRHGTRMHPEYARRLFNWIEAQDGHVGIGGGWRATGTQPDKPGFAPEGKSFHQDQTFSDGFVGYCAVDLVVGVYGAVHRAPKWSEVPEQGSDEAARWGVHCNISTETWHMQPIEIDGWQSWKDAGSPSPVANYPIPGDRPPPEVIEPPEDTMGLPYFRIDGYADQFKAIAMSADSKARNGDADVPVLVVKADMSQAELELVLGYKLTPLP